MPELPEVETIRRGLVDLLPGQRIKSVKYDWNKSFPNAKSDIDKFLIGAKITDVRRRAKVLIIDLSTGYSLVIHLKMTGQLVFVAKNRAVDSRLNIVDSKISKKLTTNYNLQSTKEPEVRFGAGHPTDSLAGDLPDRSTRIIFLLSGLPNQKISTAQGASARKKRSAEQNVQEVRSVSTGASDAAGAPERWRSFGLRPKAGQSGTYLFFNDQRKFGWVRLVPTVEIGNIDFFKKLGPEPLFASFTEKDFRERIRKRPNSSIKPVLMDQSVIAGVGNIYADESLWGAKIHPEAKVRGINDSHLNNLFKELQYVLKLSIEKGGSTDKNYVNAEGKKGSYLEFAQVFRRQNMPCPRCRTGIIKTKVGGRGTHLCPWCQKLE